MAKLSGKKSASSSKRSMKIKLNKIFNNNKSNKCTPKEVVVTRNDVKHNNINQENDEVISISSSDSDIFDNISIMSTSSTSKESSDSFTLSISSTSSDDSSRPSVYSKSNFRRALKEHAFSARKYYLYI